MGLDMMIIMKERQEQKWALEIKLKTAETPTVWKDVLSTVEDTSVVVADDNEDDSDVLEV